MKMLWVIAVVPISLICSTADARRPLAMRMNNPCAITYRHTNAPKDYVTRAVRLAKESGFRATPGDKDLYGNVVAEFRRWSSGVEVCRLFLLDMYPEYEIEDMIRVWSGGHSHRDYTAYVTRRARVHPRWVVKLVWKSTLRRIIQAMSEWEAGCTQGGEIETASLKPPC